MNAAGATSRAITIVVARAANGVIGADGAMPWHIPADLKHFKALTMGKPMIMGRKTFDSLPGLLPGRRHIVLTRDAAWSAPGAEVAGSLESALALAGEGPVSIVGGGQIYAQALPLATTVEITEIHAALPGDTHFPPLGPEWREVARQETPPQGATPGYAFATFTRAI